jgi:hypothetical protein
VLLFPARSVTLLAPSETITVPVEDIPVTGIFQVMLSEVVGAPTADPAAVPVNVTSPAVKVAGLIASLKTAVKFMGDALVGSACATA